MADPPQHQPREDGAPEERRDNPRSSDEVDRAREDAERLDDRTRPTDDPAGSRASEADDHLRPTRRPDLIGQRAMTRVAVVRRRCWWW